jgi:hypothetical protein
MELEDFETIHLAREVAREKGWDHVLEAIRSALRAEAAALEAREGAGREAGEARAR